MKFSMEQSSKQVCKNQIDNFSKADCEKKIIKSKNFKPQPNKISSSYYTNFEIDPI